MAVVELFETNYLRIETIKHAVGNPSYRWRNTYEAKVITPLANGDAAQALGEIFIDKEKTVMSSNVVYERCVVSSWEPNASEDHYDPDTFSVFDSPGVLGARTLGSQPLARNITLTAKRGVTSGHSGKLSFRGALQKDDMDGTSALDFVLNGAAALAFQTILTNMKSDMNSALVAAGGAGSGLCLLRSVTIDGSPAVDARPVTSFVVRGIRVVSADHKYFDRS